MKVDWLIVGAGYTGCVLAERIATQLAQKVLLIDVRNHIGGNAHDHIDDQGILVHQYGPHIFHTNSKKVWDYLSQFTGWRPYEHHVLALVEGKHIPLPFNLNSLHMVLPKRFARKVEGLLLEQYGPEKRVPVLKLQRDPKVELRALAEYVYDHVVLGYTMKQWEIKPEELDPSVTGRIPIVVNRDDRYFQDAYQAMPQYGYTKMFERMIRHPNIQLLLGQDYRDIVSDIRFNRMIYSGPMDAYFDYIHGKLPYRSLRFEFIYKKKEQYQEVAQVNYPNGYPYTRITEFKHMTGQVAAGTTVAKEYPMRYEPGKNTPYYPVPRVEHQELYKLYLKEAERLNGTVRFVGRLADYQYYNMDQAVGRALALFERDLCRSQIS